MKKVISICFLNTLLVLGIVSCESGESEQQLPEGDDNSLPVDSCENGESEQQPPIITKQLFNGYVQKGPYINGSTVVISQLDEYFNQTGNVFSTQIIDNSGNFEQRNIEFASNFIELKADGYYFNEVLGKNATSPLTLYALTDITDLNSVNVNILTHLERQRIIYLLQNDDLSFLEAKKQARSEVLDIFKFALPDTISTESLNIADHALLLAVSAIFQGHLSTSDMSELLANISADIKTDGKLDNHLLGSQLVNNAAFINWEQIISNMNNKYTELGITININSEDLKNYAQQFKQNCGFEQTLFIIYPETGKYGLNILAEEFVEAEKDKTEYSISANVPDGISLKIIIKGPPYDNGEYNISVNAWGTINTSNIGDWKWDRPDTGNVYDFVFTIENGGTGNIPCRFHNNCTIEYYENTAIEPTKVKEIKVTEPTKE
jgi:hypothetical protein